MENMVDLAVWCMFKEISYFPNDFVNLVRPIEPGTEFFIYFLD